MVGNSIQLHREEYCDEKMAQNAKGNGDKMATKASKNQDLQDL